MGARVLGTSVAGTAVPADFAAAVAYGDLLTTVLAVITLVALRARWSVAIGLVWLTNIVGTVDLLNALIGGLRADVATLGLGSFWFLVTIPVPILSVSPGLPPLLLLLPPPPTP